MKKSMKKLLLLPLATLLASCGYRTTNAYEQTRFISSNFLDNFYAVHDFSSSQKSEIKTTGKFQNGYLKGGSTDTSYIAEGLDTDVPSISEAHSEIFGDLPYAMNGSYVQYYKENDSSFIGAHFGRTNCLAVAESSFKDTGVLSKLYNGQLQCLNQNNFALVQLKEDGIDTKFPKTMTTSDYFFMSFRGGSILGAVDNQNKSRITYIDLDLKFYYEDGYVLMEFDSLPLWSDHGGEPVNFFGFSLSEMGIDPSNMIGYGISYDNVIDEYEGTEAYTNINDYWGLLVYEVMFLNSSWH